MNFSSLFRADKRLKSWFSMLGRTVGCCVAGHYRVGRKRPRSFVHVRSRYCPRVLTKTRSESHCTGTPGMTITAVRLLRARVVRWAAIRVAAAIVYHDSFSLALSRESFAAKFLLCTFVADVAPRRHMWSVYQNMDWWCHATKTFQWGLVYFECRSPVGLVEFLGRLSAWSGSWT